MRCGFVCLFGKLTSTKPVFLREIYRRLTGDQPCSANAKEKAIDDRLKLMIEYEDSDLILDLRTENDGKPEKFMDFLEQCQKYIDAKVETVVDDRRHDEFTGNDVVTHLATAMSINDFHEKVAESCSESIAIPSVQWLHLQFWPRRTNAAFATRQKGRLKLKFMIQERQFRKNHVDSH